MASLLTPATFEFFATYLLAGYIVIIVRSRFVTGLQAKPAELIVEAVIFSLINQLCASAIAEVAYWIGLIGFVAEWAPTALQNSELLFFAKVLVLPTVIGLLLGYNLTAKWKNVIFRRLSLPVTHPVQRAHDFAFGYNRPPGFVIVTYMDGTVIGGFFGEKSLAASDPARSDLFLESLYTIGEGGEWQEPNPPRSGLLTLSDVRTIEFLDKQERNHG